MSLFVITGGIGAGKTTVLNAFRREGVFGLDADDVAHGLYEPGQAAYGPLVERWGHGILGADGRIDRRQVAQLVFREPAELSWLNGLLHPLVREEIRRQSADRPCFCAIPLFYECGWQDPSAVVIAVWCTAADQMRRLGGRGWNREEIERRCASQLSMDRKLELAQYAIITSCSWDCLEQQCRRLCRRLVGAANPPAPHHDPTT